MSYSVGFKSGTPTDAWTGTLDVDNVRRTFGIQDQVAELKPAMTPWFAFLAKTAKETIAETVWKPLEHRAQWQRRNFTAKYMGAGGGTLNKAGVKIMVDYDKYGKVDGDVGDIDFDTSDVAYAPVFLLGGQVLKLGANNYKVAADAIILYGSSAADASSSLAVGSKTAGYFALIEAADLTLITTDGTAVASIGKVSAQVIGSAYAEGSGAPNGWLDELTNVEFYQQIFKTSVPLFSGSSMATKYRGYSDEFKRIWNNHLMSHRMDIENAMLFGYGKYVSQDERYTWGVVPYIELNGGFVQNFTYASSTYDDFVTFMKDFMAPEIGNSGDKLVLASRKIIGWFSKLSDGDSFLGNTTAIGSSDTMMKFDISQGVSSIGNIGVTSIKTNFGNLHFVEEPLLRGHAEDIAVVIDMANVKYRPLSGNGVSRDTFITTNIQDNSVDGRKDQILTEVGLQIDLVETHAIMKFS